MGLLSNVLQTGENILTLVGGGVNKIYESTLAKVPGIPQVKSFVEKNPIVVALPLTSGLSVGATTTKTAISSAIKASPALIPTTTKGKVIAAVVTPVAIGATIKQPEKVAQAIVSTPSGLVNVGGNIANLAANPSIENVKTLVSENPVLVGGAVATAAAIGVKGILPAIATTTQTQAIKEQTKAIEATTQGLIVQSTPEKDIISIPAQNNAPIPQTPQTQTIKATTTTKRKRRKTKQIMPNISQRVNVLVNNDNRRATKNYIKREVLINQ